MPLQFSSIPEHLKLEILQKLGALEYRKFSRSSQDSCRISNRIKTRFTVYQKPKPATARFFKEGIQIKLFKRENWLNLLTIPLRINASKLKIENTFTDDFCNALTNFIITTNSTARTLVLLGNMVCSSESFKTLLATGGVEGFQYLRPLSPNFYRHLDLKKISNISINSPLNDEDFTQLALCNIPEMQIMRSNITCLRFNAFLKECVNNIRMITRITVRITDPVDFDVLFDGIPFKVSEKFYADVYQIYTIGEEKDLLKLMYLPVFSDISLRKMQNESQTFYERKMVKPLAATSQKVPTRPVGDVEVSNTKGATFKAKLPTQIGFLFIIGLALYSRFYSIREASRLEWPGNLLWYNYLTFLTLLWVPSVTLTQDETLSFRHFSKSSAAFLIMFEFIVFGITALFGIYIYFLKCMIFNMVTFITLIWYASHFHLFSYNPFSENDKYALARAVSRNDANKIQIIESRSLEIVLYNQGSEAFCTDGCVLKRTIVKGKERIAFVEVALPSFTVEPFQKLSIIPLAEAEADKVALTVERLRCFGVDVGDKVITTLKLEKKDVSELEQHFIHCDFWDNQRGFTNVVETIFAKNGPQAVELM